MRDFQNILKMRHWIDWKDHTTNENFETQTQSKLKRGEKCHEYVYNRKEELSFNFSSFRFQET